MSVPAKQIRLIENVAVARRNLDAWVYSFTRRYQIALNQIKMGQTLELSAVDLQADLTSARIAASKLLKEIATIENALEDLIE